MKRGLLVLVCLAILTLPCLGKVILDSNGCKVASFGVDAYDKKELISEPEEPEVYKYRNFAFIRYTILRDGIKIASIKRPYLIGEYDTPQGAMQAITDFKDNVVTLKAAAVAVINEYTNP